MKAGRYQKRIPWEPDPLSVWHSPKSLAEILGLPKEALQSWRITEVGPPYLKLSRSAKGRVRYCLEHVFEWQRKCQRVVPENWQPIGELPGESAPDPTYRPEWMPPGRAAIAIGIPIPTMTAWRRRTIGMPYVLIGGGGPFQIMYDRCDVDAFISRRQADPSIVPVIEKPKPRKNPMTIEERKRMMAPIWKKLGHSDDEIRRFLGRRWADLIWPV
jgi:hypothetical protein